MTSARGISERALLDLSIGQTIRHNRGAAELIVAHAKGERVGDAFNGKEISQEDLNVMHAVVTFAGATAQAQEIILEFAHEQLEKQRIEADV